jgi:DNA mismatch endonuclease (patch repair protein)
LTLHKRIIADGRIRRGKTAIAGSREPKPDAARSALMARIGQKHTTPELAVRKLLRQLGYRYRLHDRRLPGTPDIRFPGRRKVIFVHGCYWHRHKGCARSTTPKTRRAFWNEKFEANIKRDRRNIRALKKLGWDVLVVWECESRRPESLADRVIAFLD